MDDGWSVAGALFAGFTLLLAILEILRRWRNRAVSTLTWKSEPARPEANSSWADRTWLGTLRCLGELDVHGLQVVGRHCTVQPVEDKAPIKPGHSRGFVIDVDPADVKQAWVAVEWSAGPFVRQRTYLMWFPLSYDDGELVRELQRQLDYGQSSWRRLIPARWWAPRRVGPGHDASVRINLSARESARLVRRQTWAIDKYAPLGEEPDGPRPGG